MHRKEVVETEMTHRALTVESGQDLYIAFSIMRRAAVRHLPVVDQGELVGILSDRDLLRHGVLENGELSIKQGLVSEAMTRGVRTCTAGMRLADVADEMIRYHVDALPVVNKEGALIGIVTSTDLLNYVRRSDGVLDLGALAEQRLS